MKTGTSITEMESTVIFMDENPWEPGKPCLKATARFTDGSELLLGDIFYDRDEKNNAVYIGRDAEGKELFPASARLPQIKSQFRAYKDDLLQEFKARMEEYSLDPVKSHGKEIQDTKTSVPSPFGPEQEKIPVENRLRKKFREPKEKTKSRTR